jgi:hypothetical protein
VAKTITEIAVDAGLISRAAANRLGKNSKSPMVVALIREANISESALFAAMKKVLQLPLLDVASAIVDPDATRELPREMATRLRALPMSVAIDRNHKVLRVAMADPTDLVAVAELQDAVEGELELCLLPLHLLEDMIEKQYRAYSTAVVQRPNARAQQFVDNIFVTKGRRRKSGGLNTATTEDNEISWRDLDLRFRGLFRALIMKGVISASEVVEAIEALKAEEQE